METLKLSSILAAVLFCTVGCSNVGNAPAGQSPEEAKAAFESKSVDEKIKIIQASPMRPDEKQRRINELKQQAGMPVDNAPATTPGGNAPSGPPGGSFPGDPRSAH